MVADLLLGVAYFFLPLIATLLFSLRAKPFLVGIHNDMIKDPLRLEILLYS